MLTTNPYLFHTVSERDRFFQNVSEDKCGQVEESLKVALLGQMQQSLSTAITDKLNSIHMLSGHTQDESHGSVQTVWH